jgi:hypothetical protein
MKHTKTVIKGNTKAVIKIRLDDECKNGHQDFSITADIYEKDKRGTWREYMGGCCHDEIAKMAPSLAPFIALHLSTSDGIPMHAIANAWYWFQGAIPDSADNSPNLGACHGGTGSGAKSKEECKAIFMEHVRCNDEQFQAIVTACPRSQVELQYALETLGFPAQWKSEADAAIVLLEELTGEKYIPVPQTRETWTPLTDAQKKDIEDKKANGYYSAEEVAKRDAQEKALTITKKVESIKADHVRAVLKLENALKVALYFASRGIDASNIIFYEHTNMISFNWNSFSRKWSMEEIDAFKASAVMEELPAGVEFGVSKNRF